MPKVRLSFAAKAEEAPSSAPAVKSRPTFQVLVMVSLPSRKAAARLGLQPSEGKPSSAPRQEASAIPVLRLPRLGASGKAGHRSSRQQQILGGVQFGRQPVGTAGVGV
ncbi:MAG: hypothetical protein Kilf2KO_28690 [Rhodospirillales bacterium]